MVPRETCLDDHRAVESTTALSSSGGASDDRDDDDDRNPTHKSRRSQDYEKMIALVGDSKVFYSSDRIPMLELAPYRDAFDLTDRTVSHVLTYLYQKEHRRAPGITVVNDVISFLIGKAMEADDEYEVFYRYGSHGGRRYLDLGRKDHLYVEIDATGWRFVSDVPVKFRRNNNMQALPKPKPGGNIEKLRRLLNVRDDQWPLIVAWLAGVFSDGPYPMLLLHGRQGTGKSNTARMLKAIIDPGRSALRADPKGVQDLVIGASQNLVLAFDNLSRISESISDGLCRLSTGGGFATRRYYGQNDEVIIDVKRPSIITSINEVATRSDLLDRSILIELQPLCNRVSELALWSRFKSAHPYILGVVLDAVVSALAKRDNIQLTEQPRLYDFAIWVTAAEHELGLHPGEFMDAYQQNIHASSSFAVENSPVGKALVGYMANRDSWTGTAQELLAEIRVTVGDGNTYLLPRTAQGLSRLLTQLAPNLEGLGLVIERLSRTGATRLLRLTKRTLPS